MTLLRPGHDRRSNSFLDLESLVPREIVPHFDFGSNGLGCGQCYLVGRLQYWYDRVSRMPLIRLVIALESDCVEAVWYSTTKPPSDHDRPQSQRLCILRRRGFGPVVLWTGEWRPPFL